MRQTTVGIYPDIEQQLADFRYGNRIPTKSAAINAVLKAGLAALAAKAASQRQAEARQ